MQKKNILFIFGTRPEAIKLMPVIHHFQKNQDLFETQLCNTGQHDEMLNQVLKKFQITIDYDLQIMQKNQTLSQMTTRILSQLESLLPKIKPDLVIVHGDTTTTFAASLAAFYHNIDIAHVEAGLRTHNIHSPFPEELNRQIVGKLATLNFAPTIHSKQNLLTENISDNCIYVTGNTVVDVLQQTINSHFTHPILTWSSDSKLIILTVHRRENINNLRNIFRGVEMLLTAHKDIKIFFPVHLNPKIKSLAQKTFRNNDQIILAEPVDVCTLHNLMNHAYAILTDSGGLQEEATSLGIPVLVLRENTERPEGVETGNIKLIGNQSAHIFNEVSGLLTNTQLHKKMSEKNFPFGAGDASLKIINITKKHFNFHS